jgi:hypothetical protein
VVRLVAVYYWLTPAFWALDALFGANLRAAAFEGHPGWKAVYYLFCVACGVAIWLRPAWTGLVGMTESAVNILALLLGFLVPYFRLVEQLAAGESAVDAGAFTVEGALSLLLSGMVCVLSFHLHAAQVGSRRVNSRTGSWERPAADS